MSSAPSAARMRRWILTSLGLATAVASSAAIFNMTFQDFHLSGTQLGGVPAENFARSDACSVCHGYFAPAVEPMATWKGSLMGQAGRDPLFYAQMTTANQDVANVGYFCMRCHVPMSFVTGNAYDPSGNSLDDRDRDGINCHFCHSMVNPFYEAGVSPPEDDAILAGLADVPQHYGNSMFVLDPTATRRGPRTDAMSPHQSLPSPFFRSGDFCGTCHDVGNVAVTRQPDGTYRYNNLDEPTPTENLHHQFPLERTYTEWKLSAFANGGVDMGGRFGGTGGPVVSSCQDCHMPKTEAQSCYFGPTRPDAAVHEFAGASKWVLDIIGIHYANDPGVDPVALEAGKLKAIEMLERAVTLDAQQLAGTLRTRVYNESGHKIPTGHIEGRRAWVNAKFYDAADVLIGEYGHYDSATAHLDEASTEVYQMRIGLSPYAAGITGLPAGETMKMSIADTIVKDTRIPPRGFNNAAYAAAGAPAVATTYADGQYWDDNYYLIPAGATRVDVTAYYQTVTPHYIEGLRDANVTDNWGDILYALWEQTDKCPPIAMATASYKLAGFLRGDLNCDGSVDILDINAFVLALSDPAAYGSAYPACDRDLADMNGDGSVDILDINPFVACVAGNCP
ncbi:hypothetical protein RAS1_17800 [Phycisphaerae bacterium RAS1]|nr:hypothetical protein RAS1_17800 [Phycisphaerae bacterium RAS1]